MSTEIADPRPPTRLPALGEGTGGGTPCRNPSFFIVGHPGPAMDFIGRLLASHPHLAVAPDVHWITQFFETRKGFNAEGLMARELLCKWVDQDRFADFEMDREEIRELVAPQERVSISDFLTRLLNSFGTRKGKALAGSLTPAYTQIIQAVHGLWPQAKFIHVIQDGRDLYLSAKNGSRLPSGTYAEDPVTTFALAWRRRVKHGRKAGKCLGPGLYHELLLEHLLNEPEEEFSRLSAFLAIGDNDAPHPNPHPPVGGGQGVGQWPLVSGEEGGVPPTTHHSPLTTHLSWRSEMPAGDVERFEAAAGDLLEKLGYPRLVSRCPPEILNHVVRIQEQFNHPPGSQTPSSRSLQRRRRKNAWTNPFVFIVGCPRSGTTLLQRILNAHSDLAVCPESFWIVYYFKKRIGLTSEGLVAPEIISRLFEYHKFYRMKMDREDLEVLLNRQAGRLSHQPISYADFVSGMFDAYADYHGKPLAGDKTPDYVRNLPTLHQLWPKAKIVHLLRDGRDVALSAINWTRKAAKLRSLFPTWGEHPVATAAAWWQWHVEPAREFGRSLSQSVYYELYYEELIANPEKECARLCAFLSLPFEPAMLRFHEGRMRNEAGLDAKNAWRPITPGLRNWRQEMAPEGLELFEAVAGGLLHELGYPRAFPQPAVETLNHAARIREAFDHQSQLLGDWLA